MRVEVYCIVNNEEVMLPYFARHCGERSSKIDFRIYNNFSTDRTVQISKELGCEIYNIDTSGEVRDDIVSNFKNSIRKNSKADWIIVRDCAEFMDNETDLSGSKPGKAFKSSDDDMVVDALDLDRIIYGVRTGNVSINLVCLNLPAQRAAS